MNGEIDYNEKILAALKGRKQNYPVALLMAYPRIHTKIVELWGSFECDLYIRELMIDDRGVRQGFPPAVGSDILYLGMVHTICNDINVGQLDVRERKAYT